MLYIKKVCLIKFSVADLILFGKFMRKQAAFDVNLIYKLFVLHTHWSNFKNYSFTFSICSQVLILYVLTFSN